MCDNDFLLLLSGEDNDKERKELEDELSSILKDLSIDIINFTPSNKELEEAGKTNKFSQIGNGVKTKAMLMRIFNESGRAHKIISELMKFRNPIQYAYALNFISAIDDEVLKYTSKFDVDYFKSTFEEVREAMHSMYRPPFSAPFPGAAQFSPPSTDIFQGGMQDND